MRQHAEKALASEHEGTGAGALVREHGALLARVAMALLGEQAAVERALEQVAKDAAHGKAPAGGDPTASATRAWLVGLTRTACAAQSLRAPRGTLRMGAAERDASPETHRDGDAGAARRSLARLKPTEREAVVLHLVGGLDARGVALACGITEDVARTRIASAVSQLIEEDGR